MLTREHRQEALSRAYVRAIAALAGMGVCELENDYGIDMALRAINQRANRRRDASVQLDLQLKSTTRASVTKAGVVYDLEAENYRDLRFPDVLCPRILVVLVQPADETAWLSQTPDELVIRHCVYWLSLKGFPDTTATSTVRVTIPTVNVFSVAALQEIMQHLARKERSVKFRNPWIDPRIEQVRPEDAQAYVRNLGWHLVGPGANPNLLLFDPPADKEQAPTFLVPERVDQGAGLQWMIDLVAELALWQNRYAGDVLTDILRHTDDGKANGAGSNAIREAEVLRKH